MSNRSLFISPCLLSRSLFKILNLVVLLALGMATGAAQTIPASQTTTIRLKSPGVSTAFKIVPVSGAIREPLTVNGGGGTWKGDIKSSNFNITLIKSATAEGKGPEFQILHIWWDLGFGSSANSPASFLREETPDGIKITMNNLDATNGFYRSYYGWKGKAKVTLIDGEPVGKPDYYKIEFYAQQLTGSDNSKIVPIAINGTVCEGKIEKASGNDIIINDQPLDIEMLSARIADQKVLEVKYATKGYNTIFY